METFEIKQESLLPLAFKIFGGALFFISLLFIGIAITNFKAEIISFLQVFGAIILALIGLILISAHYRLIVDPIKKSYLISISFLGIKTGNPLKFNSVEKIYINKVKMKSRYTSYSGHVSDFSNHLFKAFMKLDNGEKIQLDTDSNEQALKKRVEEYIRKLGSTYQSLD